LLPHGEQDVIGANREQGGQVQGISAAQREPPGTITSVHSN
jgi:hypothetical protein